MSNLTTLQISLSKFPKLLKNASPSSPPMKKYSMSQNPQNGDIEEDKLHKSGNQQKLKYNPVNTKTHRKRNHKRNIIWFNPPFNRNVSTKIGKYFLNLIDQHFLQNHHLHKIFSRNSVKVSYSCTKNIKTIINNFNKNILRKKSLIDISTCN